MSDLLKKEENNFDFGIDATSAVVSNDEMAEVKQVNDMMQRGERLNFRFGKNQQEIPYAWIESRNTEGFPMKINNERYHWLMNYLFNGKIGDTANFTKEVKPMERTDFQWEVMKAFIAKGQIIQYTPLFRIKSEKISAITTCRKGKVMFYIDRTPEVLDYLREHEQHI